MRSMKNLLSYIIGTVIAIQALTPPFEFSIHFTNNPVQFIWTFLFCGMLGILFIFTRANAALKFLIPYLFINSFFSRAPHLSMTTFIWIIIGAYFYLLCLRNTNWQPVFNILACVFVMEIFLLIMKTIHHDVLLNFSKESYECFGSIGNPMQFKSTLIIISAFLLQNMPTAKKRIVWLYTAFGAFAVWYFFISNASMYFNYARGAVWAKTIGLAMQHPIIGWGIGTFKAVFPAFARGSFQMEGIWLNAHNEFLEAWMEIGIIGIIPFLIYAINFLRPRGIARFGVIMVFISMCVYFPLHQPYTALLLVAMAAFYEQQAKEQLWPIPKSA